MVDDKEILPPDPGRMIEGLRDTGYEFNTAVADIIDNSIAARATVVDVRINMDFR
ncbi:MAG: ATP-binding protein, partial [Hyphomicrobiaceae bacterium]